MEQCMVFAIQWNKIRYRFDASALLSEVAEHSVWFS